MSKGDNFEELVRAYFASQGFFALRTVWLTSEDDDVTDIDVWLYGRQNGGARTRAVVDAKNKKTPKAYERILWTRGLQLSLSYDRAIVATTASSVAAKRFAEKQNVDLLTSDFLRNWSPEAGTFSRLTLEEFESKIRDYSDQKQDGDWLAKIKSTKSGLISIADYPAFNKATSNFAFFGERVATRPRYAEQALRSAYLCASVSCIALDSAIEHLKFLSHEERYQKIYDGVTYGDAGDGRVKLNMDLVFKIMSQSLPNGRVLAQQTKNAFSDMFKGVKGEMIAEFFSKEQNSRFLFNAGRELEERAHARLPQDISNLSVETKSVLGVLSDFAGVRRPLVMSPKILPDNEVSDAKKSSEPVKGSIVQGEGPALKDFKNGNNAQSDFPSKEIPQKKLF